MNYAPVRNSYEAPCAHYLYNPLFHMESTLTNAANTIVRGFISTDGSAEYKRFDFDTIVCTGISGVIFGVQLAQRMGRKVAIVRKDGDGSHSTNRVEANCFPNEIGKYVIVDDLTETGATVKRVVAAMKKHAPRKTEHVATYLYSYNMLSRPANAKNQSRTPGSDVKESTPVFSS